ncbi:hypothetical protein CYLTODRAFT_120115 [Cylindrobasidium torrendii FP15055 ss-10]|uniref:Uncharacterized protein n=1 Tax=Cylindrobasidium torrendii FP15055 ss-10 TaxID=1314674 RepID=A0A0D7B163_9AGAR|nr:hypothetical protein CYLTODRAFT_120115 [Cylindrobasidium torrendii FP15055 ss-10]
MAPTFDSRSQPCPMNPVQNANEVRKSTHNRAYVNINTSTVHEHMFYAAFIILLWTSILSWSPLFVLFTCMNFTSVPSIFIHSTPSMSNPHSRQQAERTHHHSFIHPTPSPVSLANDTNTDPSASRTGATHSPAVLAPESESYP